MKKIIIALLLGCFSLPLDAMQGKNINRVKESNKTQLSKLDKVKIGTAAFGSAWFGLAALLTYPALADLVDDPIILAPWLSVVLPSAYMLKFLGYGISEEDRNIFFSSTTILSSIISGALGLYAYKKLKAKSNKQFEKQITETSLI